MKTIKIEEIEWKELKQLALDNNSTIGKEIKRLLSIKDFNIQYSTIKATPERKQNEN